MNCQKCDADISDTFERDDPSCGISAGWYCATCDLSIAEWEAPPRANGRRRADHDRERVSRGPASWDATI